MADGIRCKHCGWQETQHELLGVSEGVDPQEANQRLSGRRMTLVQCVDNFGFEAPKWSQRTRRQEERFTEECLDRQARGMVAWGAWAAHCRQVQFDKTLAEKEEAIKRTSSEEGRRIARQKRDDFVTAAKRANHVMHIGPF